MEEMQRTGRQAWIDVQFVKKAVENVLKCQRTLRWTYVMAYYLEESNFKAIFEDNQRSVQPPFGEVTIAKRNNRYLETAVEDFTELLESRIDPDTIGGLLSRIKDKGVRSLTTV
jgi:ariadne-1